MNSAKTKARDPRAPQPSGARPSTDHAPVSGISGAVLRRADVLLKAWDDGTTLQELLPGPAEPMLQNGLLLLFRHRAAVDWVLAQLATRPLRPRLLRVARWVTTQVLFTQGIPPPALVNAAVDYARRRYNGAEAAFMNALLRALVACPPAEWLGKVQAEAPPAVRLGLGAELHAAWAARFPGEQLAALATLLQAQAPLCVRTRVAAVPVAVPGLLRALAPFPWAPDVAMYECLNPPTFFASDDFRRGAFYVQDPSTLLAPGLLAARPAERVADLCAAPGGKALLLSEAMHGEGVLVCADRSAGRLRMGLENLGQLSHVRFVVADAGRPPFPDAAFDAVLLDVPCSNTGVIRRRPDVRWRFSRSAVAELTAAQAAILTHAAALVRPGGRLVYSTCSLEPQENTEQVRRFLAAAPQFSLAQEQLLLPGTAHDGAYAALLCRRV